jgi:hypothetical protein
MTDVDAQPVAACPAFQGESGAGGKTLQLTRSALTVSFRELEDCCEAEPAVFNKNPIHLTSGLYISNAAWRKRRSSERKRFFGYKNL